MDEWKDGWMDGWLDGRTGGRMDGWIVGWTDIKPHKHNLAIADISVTHNERLLSEIMNECSTKLVA